LSEQAQAAAHETDQVTIERVLCDVEAKVVQSKYPDAAAGYKADWLKTLAPWEGGLLADALECAKDMLDAGVDASMEDADADSGDDPNAP
jgi:hypothetical protein